MLPDTVERLSHLPNIVAIKEATGDIERTREIVERCGDQLDVYSGDDATAKDSLFAGAKGVISVTANVAPAAMHAMCAAAAKDDKITANAIDERLQPLHKNLFVEANPIPVKWALAEMGMIPRGIRLPLTPLASEHHAVVRESLGKAGLI